MTLNKVKGTKFGVRTSFSIGLLTNRRWTLKLLVKDLDLNISNP